MASIRPMPGWALCERIMPTTKTAGGLLFGADVAGDKATESVARVLRVTPEVLDNGKEIDPGFGPGDIILIRDFLRQANPVGKVVDAEANDRVFLLSVKDALGVVSGSGRLGFYEEYDIGA